MNIPVCKRSFLSFVLFISFIIPSFSQQSIKNYTAEWKKVDDFVSKQLPQSALTEAKKIYALAKKEKQDAQVIKSLVYIAGLQRETREDNEVEGIKEIEKEVATAAQPSKSLLHSLLASTYLSYFNNNRWQIYNRTTTVNFVKEDIKTWNAEDLQRAISANFLASIKDEKLLQQTKLEGYNAIILSYGYRFLRPTMYDFLAHRALDYFTNTERDVTKPAYRFTINQKEAFAPYDEFIKTKFVTKDTGSLFYKACLIFQQLLKYHSADTRKDALIDLDIKRILFVYEHGVMKDKEKLGEKALVNIKNNFPGDSAAAYASYLLGKIYSSKGFDEAGKAKDPKALITAKAYYEEVINKFPKSYAAIESQRMLTSILEKSFSTEVEKVNLPEKPFRFLFKYRNLSKIYLRIVKTQPEAKKIYLNTDDREYWKKRTELKPLREWSQDIPDTKDFQLSSVELKIDPLPTGTYYLIISEKQGFPVDENILSSQVIHVSNISYIGSGADYFVLDRDSGKPLANATVQTWQNKYDYKTSNYVNKKSGLFKTDKNGLFKLVKSADDGNFIFEITSGNDYLFLEDEIYQTYDYRNSSNDKGVPIKKGALFTDRAIYRPGQLVYFKGLAMQFDPNTQKHTILPNFRTKVILRDANYQKVSEMMVTTNEFGTYHGSFKLPEGRLNGSFTVNDSLTFTTQQISVEEYKRPKFSVEVKKPTGTYRLNDSVTVKGIAKAYSGNTIDGAKVKYRITRSRYVPFPWWGGFTKIFPPYNRDEMEIENGEVITDKKGEFTITFLAISDEEDDEKEQLSFNFDIAADVTDINGETRSDATNVVVSNRSISLRLDIPERSLVDSFKNIKVGSFNSNDLFEPTLVTVNISSLKSPTRVFRNRLWQEPTQFVMTREESYRLFPYDLYNDEDDKTKWEKTKVLEDTFTTKSEDIITLLQHSTYRIKAGTNLQPGWYVVEITTKDKDGKMVSEKRYIQLYTPPTSHIDYMAGVKLDTLKSNGQPGEKLRYRLSTALNDIWVIQDITSFRKERERKTDILNAGSREYELDVTEEDRGGRTVNWVFVKNNRFYSGSELFPVPWTNKELNISYETFRDNVLPGSKEKWKVKISNSKGDKTAAEVLVSMYDASLDAIRDHDWQQPGIYPELSNYNLWTAHRSFDQSNENSSNRYKVKELPYIVKNYDQFFFGPYGEFNVYQLDNPRFAFRSDNAYATSDKLELNATISGGIGLTGNVGTAMDVLKKVPSMEITAGIGGYILNEKEAIKTPTGEPVQIRKNFNETAFFFPELRTDSAGAVEFSFTMPEALTKWKFLAFAHTKDLAFGNSSREIVTQKQLMVQPNPPRFMREGDKMEFSAKIVNMTDKEITGQAQFQLFDAATNQSVDGRFQNSVPNQYFTVVAGESEAIRFPIEVPYRFNTSLTWRIVAKAGDVSDGEENALPVLTNRMLVTETMPLNMRGAGTKNFTFDKLLNSGNSETLQNHSLVIEYTSNPAWNAVQALPYLMEYPYECAEQTWNHYYANSLAMMIANSSPRIKQIFEQWKTLDTAALLSNLQKNEELKSVLLEETPWVLQAKTENEQKKNIALLFDMIKMSSQLNSSFDKLKEMQSSNGGFVWFQGGPDDRYITQYIITGIGHLKKLRALADGHDSKLKQILSTAIPYLDKKIKDDYADLVKYKVDLKKHVPGTYIIQYLYMRSFFPDYKIATASQTAYTYFKSRAQQTWTQQSKYMQGMLALALSRAGDVTIPASILKSLKQTSINNEEMGMYWKDANRGWFWHEAPIERQALLIEAFQEVGKDTKTVDDLRTWLLKNKQTNNWESTKATAEACYALLLRGSQWLTDEPTVQIRTGNITVSSNDNKQEAGTGYFKKTIEGEKVNPRMGNISVTIEPSKASPSGGGLVGATWGGVYWQYFEDIDKITTASTPLKLVKKLFVEKNADRGPVLTPINDGDILKVGDKIKVRIELRVDRDMEYVHMKDMRASATEPVNVLSSYKWQGGLGYYESTKDASTNFFFNNLRKGTYVFEYPLFTTHTGNFSNGITTIQCMYAPEFSSHSEGVRINIE